MSIRQTITASIIRLLESGAAEGRPRWVRQAGLPCNALTGQAYRGINVVLLWAAAAAQGYHSNRWLTYKQAQSVGAQVRQGESGVLCVYFARVTRRALVEAESEETGLERGYPMAKAFWLFNLDQIDGLPASLAPAQAVVDFAPVAQAEQVLLATGARIRYGFDQAFYQPQRDEICLPEPGRFTSEANYYATALHELAHWTGHASRLNRNLDNRFGDHAYAMEELVEELAAAFCMGHLGLVDGMLEQHASYLDHWIRCLQADSSAIFAAASQAARASDYILGMGSQA